VATSGSGAWLNGAGRVSVCSGLTALANVAGVGCSVGRVSSIQLRQRRENGELIRELMADYDISKATVYRYLSDNEE